MSEEKSKTRTEKKRQQQARKALEVLLTKLRSACGTIEKIEQWEEYTKPLENIFRQYEDDLPDEPRAQLNNAIQTARGVTEGFNVACKVLEAKVERVIPLLPAPISIGTILIAVLIVVAVVAGGAVMVSTATASSLIIENQNCSAIQFSKISISVPGLELPNGTLNAGQSAEATIPFWLTISVDDTMDPAMLHLFAGGIHVDDTGIPSNTSSIRLTSMENPNGEELFNHGKSTPASLVGKPNPHIVVACQ